MTIKLLYIQMPEKERTILLAEGNNNPPVPATLYLVAHAEEVQEGVVRNAGDRDIQQAMTENSK